MFQVNPLFSLFVKKIRLDISCESSKIHVKYHVLFSPKKMKKSSRLSAAAAMIGACKINTSTEVNNF